MNFCKTSIFITSYNLSDLKNHSHCENSEYWVSKLFNNPVIFIMVTSSTQQSLSTQSQNFSSLSSPSAFHQNQMLQTTEVLVSRKIPPPLPTLWLGAVLPVRTGFGVVVPSRSTFGMLVHAKSALGYSSTLLLQYT